MWKLYQPLTLLMNEKGAFTTALESIVNTPSTHSSNNELLI